MTYGVGLYKSGEVLCTSQARNVSEIHKKQRFTLASVSRNQSGYENFPFSLCLEALNVFFQVPVVLGKGCPAPLGDEPVPGQRRNKAEMSLLFCVLT